MKSNVLSATGALVALSLLVTACDDPSKGKTKVTTTEAIPTTNTGATPAAAEAQPATVRTYAFDNGESKLTWVGSKVTGKHDGGFKSFRGTVKVPDGTPEKGSVDVLIDTPSIYSDVDKLTGHLQTGDFFEVQKFPTATFVSTKVEKGGSGDATHTITGNLTLRGVTKGVSFPATVKLDPDAVSVDAEFAINRKDFGIVYAGKPDDLIREDVVIKLAIRAKKS